MNFKVILFAGIFVAIIFSFTTSFAFAHPHSGQIMIDDHIHEPQTASMGNCKALTVRSTHYSKGSSQHVHAMSLHNINEKPFLCIVSLFTHLWLHPAMRTIDIDLMSGSSRGDFLFFHSHQQASGNRIYQQQVCEIPSMLPARCCSSTVPHLNPE